MEHAFVLWNPENGPVAVCKTPQMAILAVIAFDGCTSDELAIQEEYLNGQPTGNFDIIYKAERLGPDDDPPWMVLKVQSFGI
jgi:hypothetical protein